MAKKSAGPEQVDVVVTNEEASGTVPKGKTRRVRLIADRMTITVNELTIAAGVIKVVRNPPIPEGSEAEIVFDELNADEFTMRYAD